MWHYKIAMAKFRTCGYFWPHLVRTSDLHLEVQVRMPRCTILYKNKQLAIIGGGREKLCVSSVTIIYEQINYWPMPRADVTNDLWDNKKPLFYFFQTEFTNCFIIQWVSFVCFVIYSILMPKTQTTLSKLGHTQSIFSSLIYSLFPSLFFCPWALRVLYF